MLAISSGPAQAVYPDYTLDLQSSQWEISSNHLKCVMSQDIPLYGKAEFIQTAGQPMRMRVTTTQPASQVSKAVFESRPPVWNHRAKKQDLGMVSLNKGNIPFSLKPTRSKRVIAELERGMQPTFSFDDVADGKDRVEIAVSPVRFQDALQEFRSCLAQLFPYGYEQLKHTRIYFKPNEYYLDEKGKQALKRLARYIRLEKNVSLVTVHGHASEKGRFENLTLSEKRANSVVSYMKLLKIPMKLVKKRFTGDRKLVASNKSTRGRALNQRVEVRLEKPF